MRASQPALLAAGRVIVEKRDAVVQEWAERLGDRISAASTIPRSTVEREFTLLINTMAQLVGPLRRESRHLWRQASELYGRTASARGLAAGEVVEELLHLRDLMTRELAAVVAAMRARQGMALLLRLNRLVDEGLASAVVGYTDALVATLMSSNGVPEDGGSWDAEDIDRQLLRLEGELAELAERA